MKTILVATDYSHESDNALRYALDMAREAGLHVVVLHTFYPLVSPPAAYDIPSLFPELEKGKVEELKQNVKQASQSLSTGHLLRYKSILGAGIDLTSETCITKSGLHTVAEEKILSEHDTQNVTYICKVGTPYEQILNMAAAQHADLIVMGMRGGGGALSQALIGSTTASVMRNSPVPVLGVPRHARFNGFGSAVLASELSKHPDHSMLRKLSDFVRAFQASLQVLHLYSHHNYKAEYEKAAEALEAFDLEFSGLDYTVCFQQRAAVVEGIEEFVQERKADLLILSPHRYGFIERLQNRSVTSRMIGRAFLPLLALPAPSAQVQDIYPKQEAKTNTYDI